MTANAGAADRQRCLDAGMNDFLSKPVTLEAMTDVVARWVVKPAALQPAEGRDPVAQGSGAS